MIYEPVLVCNQKWHFVQRAVVNKEEEEKKKLSSFTMKWVSLLFVPHLQMIEWIMFSCQISCDVKKKEKKKICRNKPNQMAPSNQSTEMDQAILLNIEINDSSTPKVAITYPHTQTRKQKRPHIETPTTTKKTLENERTLSQFNTLMRSHTN